MVTESHYKGGFQIIFFQTNVVTIRQIGELQIAQHVSPAHTGDKQHLV